MEWQKIVEALGTEAQIIRELPSGTAVTGLAYDSRKVIPGGAFVAIRGERFDGHDFIDSAVQSGAALIIAERTVSVPFSVALIVVQNSRLALALLSAAFYDHPDRSLRLIGVTGTNGKTTTTNLIKYLLTRAGYKTGVIGTVGSFAGDEKLPDMLSASTTPESLELFFLLRQMVEKGCTYAVIEVSSHSLSQGRVSALHFTGAVFTNLTQDHLDYHGTMQEYGKAKSLLFAMLDSDGYGVINTDDRSAVLMCRNCVAPVINYGMDNEVDLQLLSNSVSIKGMEFSVLWQHQKYIVHIPLIGKFNVMNTLAAMGAVLKEGLVIDEVIRWLENAPQVPGRFELIDEGQDFAVVVDYAHTPDGLSNVLTAARDLHPHRLITVFGCGGDRDITKRPQMGRIAGQMSDAVVVTSDNPRYEDPDIIIDMIKTGLSETGNNFIIEKNRSHAIELAIGMAEPGDLVVIAGKGHEDYQIVQDEKLPFDDREEARRVIRGLDK